MMVTAARSDNDRNQLTCIEKGKPKNNNEIRQHEKQTHLSIPPVLFSCPTPLLLKQSPLRLSSPSILTTTSNTCGQPSPPPAACSGGSGSSDSSQYREHLAMAACKSFPQAYAHQQLQL
jgi:hypothetical protein